MRICEVYQARKSRIVELAEREILPGEVAVRVRACGVCGSEFGSWSRASAPPLYLGHEVAGEVVGLGAGVVGLSPGDLVTGLFRRGFAEWAAVESRAAMRCPPGLSPEIACLGEPISCVVSGALRTDLGLGKTVAVIGLGFMGTMALQLMRLKGACCLVAVDARPELADRAARYGADEFYTPSEVPERHLLRQGGGGGGVDIALECTGNAGALDLAVLMLKRHSILSVVGFHQGGPRSVDFEMLGWKAADIVNAHEKRVDFKMDCMDIGLRLVTAGQLRVEDLVTHRYGLESLDRAFEDFERKPGGYIKGIVAP
jgi:threonine dehydrogenase-like Zn-dependent dehydrogenase